MTSVPTATITCTLCLTIRRADGPIAAEDVAYAQWLLDTSISNRLFGDGFLPPSIEVDTWSIISEAPQNP
ncbi:MAG: hypothetical protein AB7E81_04590 [Hyphomicrobiaceae bacterium]